MPLYRLVYEKNETKVGRQNVLVSLNLSVKGGKWKLTFIGLYPMSRSKTHTPIKRVFVACC